MSTFCALGGFEVELPMLMIVSARTAVPSASLSVLLSNTAGGRPLGSGNAPGTVEALVSTVPVLVSVQEVLPLCERAALAFTSVTAACPPVVLA